MSQRRPLVTEEQLVNRSSPVRLLTNLFWLTFGAGMFLLVGYLLLEAIANQVVGR